VRFRVEGLSVGLRVGLELVQGLVFKVQGSGFRFSEECSW